MLLSRLHLSLTFAAVPYYNSTSQCPMAEFLMVARKRSKTPCLLRSLLTFQSVRHKGNYQRIRVDIRCQMGYNSRRSTIEHPRRWGRVPRVARPMATWTPKGQAGWVASRPANLSGQETPPCSASGKLDVLCPTPMGQIPIMFGMNLSGQQTEDARQSTAYPLFCFLRSRTLGSCRRTTHRPSLP